MGASFLGGGGELLLGGDPSPPPLYHTLVLGHYRGGFISMKIYILLLSNAPFIFHDRKIKDENNIKKMDALEIISFIEEKRCI